MPKSGDTPKSSVPTRRNCGTQAVHERLLREDSAYRSARVESEGRAFAARRSLVAGRTGVTVIPVVVHVLHKTADQNISDAQIKSQIDVLNHDYRKTNADVSKAPGVFAPLAADARVEFELATKDPNGAATGGITRTATNKASFSDSDDAKSAGTGGADPWPADKYLNIWTVPKLVDGQGHELLGYAQFPGGPAATDGVVILHSGFGNTGTAAAPFNLGRTTTHEVGHWLNLRHIWGDDGGGCNGDDFVDDTPNAADHNFGKPAFPHVTCNNGPNGDMFMNYMDYTDDDSMFMFTAGQVKRMQTCLDTDRSSIGHVKPSIKLKFRDDGGIPTLKFSDDGGIPKTKIQDDIVTLKFRDDLGVPKTKFVDDQTLKFRDDPKLKFIDDPVGKAPGADPIPGPGPGPGPVEGPAPFILATPHHSRAWTRSFPGAYSAAVSSYQTQLAQYQAALDEYAKAEDAGQLSPDDVAEGDRLYAEYTRVAEEYRQLTGG